ncbi:tRNA (adenosine(37)-N6)-threonylcarbamoyltransferase complex transferase subunit TsaD [Candidatus Daviesbacteria bacterium]|nr:tRNA (adenosine(37)-N6)-threonylcarbamoyltransferase complex transferase subunit TsaD [Candidatus Daviesbacteria bacterium]
MIILGIETSCDETAAAVLQKTGKQIKILSNVVASSATLQAKYGGVIPEQAAREQLRSIIPVIQEALTSAFKSTSSSKISNFKFQISKIDAIAVTYGPGLIGSLLVGVETAKTLALTWNKPLIPVNHLLGHFYANWITSTHLPGAQAHLEGVPKFPCIGLLVSGGHTDLVLFEDYNKYKYLGGTRDDAAGECFDKCARLLGLPYPGGPQIAKLAQTGNPDKFILPIPMRESKDFDFSYSGLKTAVANLIKETGKLSQQEKADLASSIEQTIVTSLIDKVVLAIQHYNIDQIMVAGGVAANQRLKEELESRVKSQGKKIKLHIPPPELCTDNAAMIASAAFFLNPIKNPVILQANPNLSL